MTRSAVENYLYRRWPRQLATIGVAFSTATVQVSQFHLNQRYQTLPIYMSKMVSFCLEFPRLDERVRLWIIDGVVSVNAGNSPSRTLEVI
jgi:hypothetical protein